MKILNKDTAKAKNFIKEYEKARYSELYRVYNNPSQAKWKAFNYCFCRYRDENGKQFKIISHNIHYFTVGYLVDNTLRIITACEYYYIQL